MANGNVITFDKSTLTPIAAPKSGSPADAAAVPSKTPGITLDKSTLAPINITPDYVRSRTLMNMTRAMSGQAMDNPEDQAQHDAAYKAGFESAGTTALTTLGGELLLAPRAVAALSKVPAGRDPVTGRMLPWVVKSTTEEGSSLAKAGFDALKAAGEAHPLVKQLIISGLSTLGAGGIAKALGWIGKAVAEP